MASGLAVIAYNHAAAGQLIRHQQNGMLIAAENEQEMFSAAAQIVQSNVLRASIRQRGRQTAVEHDWNSVVARTESIFRSLIHPTATV